MPKLSIIKGIMVVALVLAALAYGTRQAVAGTGNMTCLDDPPAFLGDCPGSDEACELLCQGYGEDWHGYCTGPTGTGCCVCFL